MIELFTGAALTLISLLVGYQLGKHQRMIPERTQKKINEIFDRVVPNPEVGAIPRPTPRQNYYRDNPQALVENDTMTKELDDLNRPPTQ